MKKLLSVFISVLMLCACFAGALAYAENQLVLGVNAVNGTLGEGHSLIFTRKNGTFVSTSSAGLCWWRSATFEWSDDADAYIVTSVDLTVDGTNGKNNYVPENGFVLLVNIGNDYGNVNYINKLSTDTYNKLAELNVGDRAYLTGIDLAKGTVQTSGGKHYDKDFTSDGKIYIGEKPEGVDIYRPDTSLPQLESVVLPESGSVIRTDGIKVEWEGVDGADEYVVTVNTSTVITDGTVIVNGIKTKETSYTVDASKLKAGCKYTVTVTATGSGKRPSVGTRRTYFVVSEKCASSPFLGKKIVAFGDSLTAFTGWVSMLSGELGTEIINSGVGGDKTTEALARIKTDVIDKSPDIVIMMFGMNDQAMKISSKTPLVSLGQYEKNYRKMINMIHDAGADIVLMTGNNVCTDSGYYVKGQYDLDYGTGNLNNYFEVIRKLAEEYNLNLIDMNKFISEEGIKDSVICASGDGIHLSTKGQEKYTEWISDYMYNGYAEKPFVPDADHTPKEESSAEESKETSKDVSEETSSEESTASSEQKTDVSAENTSKQTQENSKGGLNLPIVIISVIIVAFLTYLCFSKPKNK